MSKELTLVIGLSVFFLMFLPPMKMGSQLWKKGPPPEMLSITGTGKITPIQIERDWQNDVRAKEVAR